MKAIVYQHFEIEIRKARAAVEAENFTDAWTALQRAHILGQNYPLPHAIAHWEMLKLAWRQKDFKEVIGQSIPTILAVPLTFLFGRKRSLRVGKANVNSSGQKPIPEDLLKILES